MPRLTITRPRERVEITSYSRFWERADLPGAGYGPECDAHGTIDVAATHPVSLLTLEAIQSGQMPNLIDRGIRTYARRYTQPAQGTCACGRTVTLDHDGGDGIDCACGRIYNLMGQELAPRAQWEEN